MKTRSGLSTHILLELALVLKDVKKGTNDAGKCDFHLPLLFPQSCRFAGVLIFMGKGAALEDIPPPRRWEIEQPGPPVKDKPPIDGGADAPLTDSSRLFWTICGDGGCTTRAMLEGKGLGQFVPKLRNEKRRPLSCWAALCYVVVFLFWKYRSSALDL